MKTSISIKTTILSFLTFSYLFSLQFSLEKQEILLKHKKYPKLERTYKLKYFKPFFLSLFFSLIFFFRYSLSCNFIFQCFFYLYLKAWLLLYAFARKFFLAKLNEISLTSDCMLLRIYVFRIYVFSPPMSICQKVWGII